MGFLDHLEEFRWRIIKAVIGVVVCAIVIAVFSDWIVNNILLLPARNTSPQLMIQNLKPYGQFTLYLEVILIGGLILSVPNIFYQFWKFIEPALMPNEKKYISLIIFFTTFCFMLGVLFVYYILLPTTLGFFATFGTETIENKIAADEYLSFVLSLLLVGGIVFELPMISYVLSRVGILKPGFMRKYRRHAIVIILIIAGVLTPSPDAASQLLLGIPLLLLYELSILICKFAQKKELVESTN
ncbi:MAG: twin-arginine translocase subunit TatC [Ignavibacteria bacterium]|nr:twin-arginine translocase subunit TatC [Ignavibacteria bacterium]